MGNEVPAIDRQFLSVSLAEVLGLGNLTVPPSVMPVVSELMFRSARL